ENQRVKVSFHPISPLESECFSQVGIEPFMRLHSFPVNRFEYFEVGGIAAHDFGVSADTRQVERDTSGKRLVSPRLN
ncbi:hypothetical protein K24_18915, partial [Klebsiella pneumoniae]